MSIFKFQQFSINQSESGMKICTDSTLFGAMMPIKNQAKVIDIGAGTGLLSLMAAQLGAASVKAIEITNEAYNEALINFKNSHWKDIIDVVLQDIISFTSKCDDKFDLIISNPPFFENHSKSENLLRNLARHTEKLSFSTLVKCANKLLNENGLFYCLIPVFFEQKAIEESLKLGLYVKRKTYFHSFLHKDAKVVALTLSKKKVLLKNSHINIYKAQNVYSKKSKYYLQSFLLRFTKNS